MKIESGQKIKIILPIIIVLLICVILNIRFIEHIPSNGQNRKIGRAITDIRCIVTAYIVEESDIDKDFLKKNQVRLNAELTKMLQLERSSRRLSPDGEFLDPWGTPYHIRIDFDAEPIFDKEGDIVYKNKGEIILGDKKIKERIIIWSSGPNKINEFGKGDDIKSW